jgi:hypothetical protein
MFRASIVLLLLLLVPTGSHSQHISLSLTPQFSHDTFHALGFEAGIDLGIAVGARIDSAVMIGASIAYGRRSRQYDAVEETEALNAGLLIYGCSVEFPVLGRDGGTQVTATIGGGGISTTVEKRTVSAGALGRITIPARTDARGYVQAGALVGIPVFARIDLVVQPVLRILAPLSSPVADMSIAGGIRVRII